MSVSEHRKVLVFAGKIAEIADDLQELTAQISLDTACCLKVCGEYMSRGKSAMDGFAVLL